MLKCASLAIHNICLRCLLRFLRRHFDLLKLHFNPDCLVMEAREVGYTSKHRNLHLLCEVLDVIESAWFTARFVSPTRGKSDDSARSL